MNDPGLDEPIGDSVNHVVHGLKDHVSRNPESGDEQTRQNAAGTFRDELKVDEEEEEVGFFHPMRWWYLSTAFPLIAGTFGPMANLFSIAALVQSWRLYVPDGQTVDQGQRIPDPSWMLASNALSLALALIANLSLLFNFAHRIKYTIAQPITIILWYLSAILLIVPMALIHNVPYPQLSSGTHTLSQSFYYGVISATVYMIISTLLVANCIGAYFFHAYPPSFDSLTIPQRTLMLQTISYLVYLSICSSIFSSIEGWSFVDGLYWADYTLLTVGLGTDFPLTTNLGKGLLIPFAVAGITMIGLVIGSIRSLVLERIKLKVMRRRLGKERDKWIEEREGSEIPNQKREERTKQEFYAMRRIQARANTVRRYTALGVSFISFCIVWFGGAVVFWRAETAQSWSYFYSLYFSYTSLLTIGYGDLYPQSNAGKPFFVIWSLIAVPTVTILISNLGETLVAWLRDSILWLGQRTILPEERKNGKRRPGTKANLRWRGVNAVTRLVQRERQAEESEENGTEDDAEQPSEKGDKIPSVGGDLERLGGAVEHAEEREGHPDSLAARIAREISVVAKDFGRKPPPQYDWEQWKRWLDLLSEEVRDASAPNGKGDEGGPKERGARSIFQPRSSRDTSSEKELTWLSDHGPLFGSETETEWVLGRLCVRLEEVLRYEKS